MVPASRAQTRQPEWDKRIRRAAELADRFPHAAEVLKFYGRLLEFQQKVAAEISREGASASPEGALRQRLDPDVVLPHLPALLSLAANDGPSKLAEQAAEIGATAANQQRDLIRGFLSQNGGSDEVSRSFFPLALLQPYAEVIALTYPPRPPGPGGSLGPLCNSRPQAALLRPEGDGGKRFLLCSLCLTEWEFRRVLCPGGVLLLGFHAGDASRLKTEGYGGHPMKVYVYRRQPADMAAALRDAGFAVEAHMLLDPDDNVPGALLFARCPS